MQFEFKDKGVLVFEDIFDMLTPLIQNIGFQLKIESHPLIVLNIIKPTYFCQAQKSN